MSDVKDLFRTPKDVDAFGFDWGHLSVVLSPQVNGAQKFSAAVVTVPPGQGHSTQQRLAQAIADGYVQGALFRDSLDGVLLARRLDGTEASRPSTRSAQHSTLESWSGSLASQEPENRRW